MCAYFLSSDSAFSAPKVTQYLNINNKNPQQFNNFPHHSRQINQE